ncbi:hypothetical protein PROFUN_16414 [Planoprotostelium fungivorum]|uniref:Uncharacterized protein n=1 Tax=Planoprotostelium fungivorum TaxID=1890364 RepID=A0A2P6MQX7_9EUKA|nr:hypothetical protein PROFUN_16414 [Planoprotostelium fungivorum]
MGSLLVSVYALQVHLIRKNHCTSVADLLYLKDEARYITCLGFLKRLKQNVCRMQ